MTSTTYTQINIQAEAIAILKTVVSLEQKFTAKYVTYILKGWDKFLRTEMHKHLETFGAYNTLSEERLLQIIDFLEEENYLYIKDNEKGILGISAAGLRVIAKETAVWAEVEKLKTSELARVLGAKLKEVRKAFAQKESRPIYEVFTDYMLKSIVKNLPQTASDLKEIAGFNSFRLFRYGKEILESISFVQENLAEAIIQEKQARVMQTGYLAVKKAFESGANFNEIALKCNLKPYLAARFLSELHETGHIDLKRWIEGNVNVLDLHKGVNFFHNHQDVSLKDAYWTLGLAYPTLMFCKVYIS